MNGNRVSSLIIVSLLGVISLINSSVAQSSSNSSLIVSTDRYEFYSNFWVNMHHFLYKKAEQGKDRHWKGAFDDRVLNRLNDEEQEMLGNSLRFYKDNLIEKDLLFNDQLYWTKRALVRFEIDDILDHEAIQPEHQQILNHTKNVYEKYFWEAHHNQNRLILEENLPLIKKIENEAFERIAGLAQHPWPEDKVRIDISYYSNWAGAYTTVTPIHAVITSQTEGPDGEWPEFGWLELLFHEPSHAVISPSHYTVANAIEKVSKELELEIPGNLWHATLFYFSGKVVQDLLNEEGIEYELLMVTHDIFSRYHAPVFEYLPAYIQGKESLEDALRKIIKRLNN